MQPNRFFHHNHCSRHNYNMRSETNNMEKQDEANADIQPSWHSKAMKAFSDKTRLQLSSSIRQRLILSLHHIQVASIDCWPKNDQGSDKASLANLRQYTNLACDWDRQSFDKRAQDLFHIFRVVQQSCSHSALALNTAERLVQQQVHNLRPSIMKFVAVHM